MSKTITLSEEQIKLILQIGSASAIFDAINIYMKDYYNLCHHTMNPKRKENVKYLGNRSIPYMKKIDDLLDQLRDQLRDQQKEDK